MRNNSNRLPLLLLLLCGLTVVQRQLPLGTHNLSALGALAIVSGAYFRPFWLALAFPLGTRLLTDCLLQYQTGFGFYSSLGFDYAAYALIVLLACRVRPQRFAGNASTGVFAGAATGFVSATIFFLVSNFGAWLLPMNGEYLYPQTLQGLFSCYRNGIPFARGTFGGDMLFTPIYLLAVQMLLKPVPNLPESTVRTAE